MRMVGWFVGDVGNGSCGLKEKKGRWGRWDGWIDGWKVVKIEGDGCVYGYGGVLGLGLGFWVGGVVV